MASTTSDIGDTSSKYQQVQRPRSSLLSLHMFQSTCFGAQVETGASKDDSGSQGQYREQRRGVRGKMTLTVEYSEKTVKNVEHFRNNCHDKRALQVKGEVRTVNDRNICERRSCMKNNGKSPTFKFVSGEERRPSEVQRVSWGWRLPGATHSSADLTWIRK